MQQALLPFFQDRTAALLQLLQALVEHESPSSHKALVDALGRYLVPILEEAGANVEIIAREQVGDILFATWHAEAPGKPILFLTHMDTVWPPGTLGQQVSIRQAEGRFYGPGALDMKAGIALVIETIRALRENAALPQRPLWLLITSDEEISSQHSRAFILDKAQHCGLCLVMEPATANEGLKTWRKGHAAYTLSAQGLAAHAGAAPEAGINAVVELAHQAVHLHRLNQLRKGTSVSVTRFTGGSASNVIPAEASCSVDVRFLLAAEGERIDHAIRSLSPALPGSSLQVSGGISRMPMERDAQMIRSFQQAKAIAAAAGLPTLYEDGSGGVSDGNFVAAAGIPTLDGMGAYGDGMHALHEHVLISSLPRRAALLAAIIQHWQME